jgi:hypothetical protein
MKNDTSLPGIFLDGKIIRVENAGVLIDRFFGWKHFLAYCQIYNLKTADFANWPFNHVIK